MHLPHNFFDQLRDQINISDVVRQKVALTKKGHEYTGLCPFHSEKTPSFTVSDQKKFYHCFGCAAHGDVIRFVAETSGMSPKEAAIKLAEDNGIEVPKPTAQQAQIYEETEEALNALSIANQFFVSQLSKPAMRYLSGRRMSDKSIADYSIGFAPTGEVMQKHLESKKIPLKVMHAAGLIGRNEAGDIYSIFKNRIMFPIKNIYGKVIAFGGRILGEGQPKYLNSPETLVFKKSETLYGEDKATGSAYQKRRIIVVEGYMDVIAMQSAGFLETVATLGTAVTVQHLARLWRISDEIIFCMDGDNAGIRSMQKVILTILPLMKDKQNASFLVLPGGLDPDDAVNSLGKSYIDDLLEKRLGISEMIWYLETRNKKFTTPESKANLEAAFEEYIKLSSNPSLGKYMRSDFKNKIWSLGRKTKTTHVSTLAPITNLVEPLEIVLYNIFALILKSQHLLGDEKICSEFMEIELTNETFDAIRSHILEIYGEKGEINIADLEKIAQNSGFLDVFVLLSSQHAPFIDKMSLENSNIDPKLLWNLWIRRYQCELMKKEYAGALVHANEANFAKAKAYMEQINKAELVISEISEEILG